MGKRTTRGARQIPEHDQLRKLAGANIKDIRKGQRMSVAELAKEVKIDRRTVNRIERGDVGTTLDSLGHIADKLHLRDYSKLFAPRDDIPALTGEGDPQFREESSKTAQRLKGRRDKKSL